MKKGTVYNLGADGSWDGDVYQRVCKGLLQTGPDRTGHLVCLSVCLAFETGEREREKESFTIAEKRLV